MSEENDENFLHKYYLLKINDNKDKNYLIFLFVK
jgi:hypothetical protein